MNTPPFGVRKQSATLDMIVKRIEDVEADGRERGEQLATHGERLVRVETKLDTLIEMQAEDRRERSLALAETHKTERVRIGSRAKIFVALFGAFGVVAGAVAAVLSGCA